MGKGKERRGGSLYNPRVCGWLLQQVRPRLLLQCHYWLDLSSYWGTNVTWALCILKLQDVCKNNDCSGLYCCLRVEMMQFHSFCFQKSPRLSLHCLGQQGEPKQFREFCQYLKSVGSELSNLCPCCLRSRILCCSSCWEFGCAPLKDVSSCWQP